MFKMGYTKTVLKFSARKIFTKITFLSLQNVGWTGFHYSRKGVNEKYSSISSQEVEISKKILTFVADIRGAVYPRGSGDISPPEGG